MWKLFTQQRWDLRTAETAAEGTSNRAMTTGLVLPTVYLPAGVRARTARPRLGARNHGSQ